MMNKDLLAIGAALAALQCLPAKAHTLWINMVPAPGKHVVTSIGYGDTMPGNEILTPDWGPMTLEAYDVVSPDGATNSLGVPKLLTQDKQTLKSGVSVQSDPDVGVRKLKLGTDAQKGTWQLSARTPLVRLVHYRDKQGKEQVSEQPVEKLKDVAEVLDTKLEVNFMKAMFAVGGWSEPAPLGHPLEIVPLSDLEEARVGDVVRFKVLLNGKAWDPEEGLAFITAHNTSFGDRWGLYSLVEDGEGEFRLPTAGPWRVDVSFRGQNSEIDAYKNAAGAKGKPLPLLIESSFVFHVMP